MRETLLDIKENESIVVSELRNLYDTNSKVFYSFMNDILELPVNGEMRFSFESKCEDLKRKTNINVSHIFQSRYDIFVIDGKDKTHNKEYLTEIINFLTNQNNMYPQILICVSAEYFTDVNNVVNQILTQITRSKNEYFIKVIDVYYLLYQLEQYKHNMGV